MNVLFELLRDVTKLLETIDALEEVDEGRRQPLKDALEQLTFESVRLLKGADDNLPDGSRREVLFQRALEAIAKNRLDEAKSILSAAIDQFPKDAELHNHLGLIAWENGDMDEAALQYEKGMAAGFPEEGVVDWFDDEHRPFLRAMEGNALALYQVGRTKEAMPLFESLADMHPVDYSGCRYLAGEIRHHDGDIQGAIGCYEAVPAEPAVLYNLALAYYQSGRIADAVETFLKAFVSNRFIALGLTGKPMIGEQTVGGYLASAEYGREFVGACAQLWTDETSFLNRVFDNPLMQIQIRECERELSKYDGAPPEQWWDDILGARGNMDAVVKRVVDELAL